MDSKFRNYLIIAFVIISVASVFSLNLRLSLMKSKLISQESHIHMLQNTRNYVVKRIVKLQQSTDQFSQAIDDLTHKNDQLEKIVKSLEEKIRKLQDDMLTLQKFSPAETPA